ncbi:unnamed protein product [Durusdinium trenchii]|uniref:Transmembrane protein n=1 Tax=Durusdinium trenchii TaxID=1381693 RepID=A0ABP0LXL6_9DINO
MGFLREVLVGSLNPRLIRFRHALTLGLVILAALGGATVVLTLFLRESSCQEVCSMQPLWSLEFQDTCSEVELLQPSVPLSVQSVVFSGFEARLGRVENNPLCAEVDRQTGRCESSSAFVLAGERILPGPTHTTPELFREAVSSVLPDAIECFALALYSFGSPNACISNLFSPFELPDGSAELEDLVAPMAFSRDAVYSKTTAFDLLGPTETHAWRTAWPIKSRPGMESSFTLEFVFALDPDPSIAIGDPRETVVSYKVKFCTAEVATGFEVCATGLTTKIATDSDPCAVANGNLLDCIADCTQADRTARLSDQIQTATLSTFPVELAEDVVGTVFPEPFDALYCAQVVGDGNFASFPTEVFTSSGAFSLLFQAIQSICISNVLPVTKATAIAQANTFFSGARAQTNTYIFGILFPRLSKPDGTCTYIPDVFSVSEVRSTLEPVGPYTASLELQSNEAASTFLSDSFANSNSIYCCSEQCASLSVSIGSALGYAGFLEIGVTFICLILYVAFVRRPLYESIPLASTMAAVTKATLEVSPDVERQT